MTEKEAANELIKEILESYLEFIELVLDKIYEDDRFISIIAKKRKKDWTEFKRGLK